MSQSNKEPKPKKSLRKIVAELISDFAIVVGIVGVAAGAGMIYPPAGYVVGGIELIVLGFLTAP